MSASVRESVMAIWIAMWRLISIGDVDRRADDRQARIEVLEREIETYRRRHADRHG